LVAFILREAEEGMPVGEVCRKAGISEATFYVWRKKYAGLVWTSPHRVVRASRRKVALQDVGRYTSRSVSAE
jgi:putative transposase